MCARARVSMCLSVFCLLSVRLCGCAAVRLCGGVLVCLCVCVSVQAQSLLWADLSPEKLNELKVLLSLTLSHSRARSFSPD